MLVELWIRDFALIESCGLEFGPGLNVITGETGAGKSLLVGALEMLSGEPPRGGAAAWVRDGAAEARVDGRIVVGSGDAFAAIHGWLEGELPAIAEELEGSRDDGEAELILGRSLSIDGRTRAYVNQRPITLRALRELAGRLFEIHGQNDHQRLLEPAEQLRLLDAYGGLGQELGSYRECRGRWLELRGRADLLEAARDARHDRLELLRFQRDELAGAAIEPGERDDLVGERQLLRNAGELRGELDGIVAELAESDGALLDRLRSSGQALARWVDVVPALGGAAEDLASAGIHLEEACGAISSLKSGVEVDPRRLDAVEERLAEIERLERRYGVGADELPARITEIEAEIVELEGEEEDLGTLAGEIAGALGKVERHARSLGAGRRALALRLAQDVVATLGKLGLRGARFEAGLLPRGGEGADDAERFGPDGADGIEFLLSANPGEPLSPLRRVASGGEAARIMLALRTALSNGEHHHALVFDEIDAGVGGRLGPEVGRHLRSLARHSQVLCITHLPAIAAQADVHLRAFKEVRDGRTRTVVERIDGDGRVREVAAMIAGGGDEGTARAEAVRLLKVVT